MKMKPSTDIFLHQLSEIWYEEFTWLPKKVTSGKWVWGKYFARYKYVINKESNEIERKKVKITATPQERNYYNP